MKIKFALVRLFIYFQKNLWTKRQFQITLEWKKLEQKHRLLKFIYNHSRVPLLGNILPVQRLRIRDTYFAFFFFHLLCRARIFFLSKRKISFFYGSVFLEEANRIFRGEKKYLKVSFCNALQNKVRH